MKSAKLLCDKGELSNDIILMFDEMYLQKEAQFSGGEMIGMNQN